MSKCRVYAKAKMKYICGSCFMLKPKHHWSCIAHLSAEDMLKSAIIEERQFKHSTWGVADNPFGPKFWCQQEVLITMVICCKLQGLITTWGQNFDVNRNILSLWSFVASLKKSLWCLIFIHFFFHDLIHVYSFRAGADSLQGTKFWCLRIGLITLPKVSKKSLWSLILYNVFHDLVHAYSLMAGGIQPPGDKVSMSTETSRHFGHLLIVSNHWRQQFLKNPLFYLFPIQKHKGPNLTLS